MRELTEEEVQKELSDIARWPSDRPWVYMKNLYTGYTGYRLAKAHRDHKPCILNCEDTVLLNVQGESLEALIRKGWVVD